jgi:hypothetical protein
MVRGRERRDQVAHALPGIPDLATLAAMDDAAVVAAWIAGRTPTAQLERAIAEGRLQPEVANSARDSMNVRTQRVALGAIEDGERIAHVLYREALLLTDDLPAITEEWLRALPADEAELQRDLVRRGSAEVQVCRRQADGSWRLVASRFMLHLGMTYGFSTRVDVASADPSDDGATP